MIIGVPRETERLEHRVGLTPSAVARLVPLGHSVVVERNAGADAHFSDLDYQQAGAETAYTPEEVYQRSDLVCQVGMLPTSALELIKPGSQICAFHHLAVAPRAMVDRLMALEVTLIGYEIITDADDERPVLLPMSDLAGQMAIHEAGHLLQIQAGGRGILLGNTPGVPAATVLILGAGEVGTVAARHATAIGAHVIVMDADARKLQRLFRVMGGRVQTSLMDPVQLARYATIADVLIGAVLVPGGRAPFLVSEATVKAMKPGSVIVDVSIDQGGCVETSRPTTLDHPTFRLHDVVHYCVPNMTSDIARTASRVLSHAAMPYLTRIAGSGLDRALLDDPGLAEGLYLYRGHVVHEALAALVGVPRQSLGGLLARGARG